MLPCFTRDASGANIVRVLTVASYERWLAAAPGTTKAWLELNRFKAKAGAVALLPGAAAGEPLAIWLVGDTAEPWDASLLQQALPAGAWRLDDPEGAHAPGAAALGWALAAYRYDRYRKPKDEPVRLLYLDDAPGPVQASHVAEAVWRSRDLITTPSNDMGPADLGEAVRETAQRFGAGFTAIVGEALLDANYPAIYTVGMASPRAPRLLDLVWGAADAPKVTLVGKGVCFDTGGLDIKPSSGMLMMKKDMGGAAIMLGLAQAIMAANFPVRLRLLIPAVENSIAGNAFRPGDVIRTRKGLTVEIGNTDAEGRLVLADALAEADTEKPELLLDAATLTGAARTALGTELPAMFTPDDALAAELLDSGRVASDPMWRMPLHAPYRKLIDSPIADINNAGSTGFAGAITAALFLQEFVTETKAWAHLDTFAWNQDSRPGRPKGAEATALRAMFNLIERRYAA